MPPRPDHRSAGGPLLLPGRPWTLAGSCAATARLYVAAPRPNVPGWVAGPFLFPGTPAIPAPEFCALGIAAGGAVGSADAVRADIVSATAAAVAMSFVISVSIHGFHLWRTSATEARSDLSPN